MYMYTSSSFPARMNRKTHCNSCSSSC